MGNVIAKITKFRSRMKNLFDVFEGRMPRVLIIGLDGAGKTSLLYHMRLSSTVYANVPPRGINIEHVVPKRGATLQVYDMTGHKLSRHLWSKWYRGCEALVFVVDSSDRERIDEAKYVLHEELASSELKHKVPVVVVASKQDVAGAMTSAEVSSELDLEHIADRDWSLLEASPETGVGVKLVFTDVVEKIKAYRHYKSGLTGNRTSERRESKKSATSRDSKGTTRSERSSIEEEHNAVDIAPDAATTNLSDVPSLFDSINRTSSSSGSKIGDEDHVTTGNNVIEQSSDLDEENIDVAMYDDIENETEKHENVNSIVETTRTPTEEDIRVHSDDSDKDSSNNTDADSDEGDLV